MLKVYLICISNKWCFFVFRFEVDNEQSKIRFGGFGELDVVRLKYIDRTPRSHFEYNFSVLPLTPKGERPNNQCFLKVPFRGFRGN